MKQLFIIGIVLLHCFKGSAQGLHPFSTVCLQPFVYMHPGFPGSYSIKREFSSNNCVVFNEATPTGNLISEGRTDVIAGQSIHIAQNMHINFAGAPDVGVPPGEPGNPQFHAFIGHNDFDVFWYEPNSTVGTVGKYEKLELGLRIPSTLETSINNYINNTVTADKLNPFDPNQVKVEAQFYFLDNLYSTYNATPDKLINGFYYKEYTRITDHDNIANEPEDYWDETDTITFPFRIRFAPDKIGNWAVKIKIITPTTTLEALPVNFYCSPSGNPGYVKVGSSTTFFSLGNNTFYPIGLNLAWPLPDQMGMGGYLWEDAYAVDKITGAEAYEEFGEAMVQLKNSGANSFRLIITPWTYEVEFEELGNYTQRMRNVWELDKVIELADQLDLKIMLDLQVHYPFENPSYYGWQNWDWTANTCGLGDPAYTYSEDLGLSVKQFFSDPLARTSYENRLRYILSRINYSTSILSYEIMSEINNMGKIVEYDLYTSGGCGPPIDGSPTVLLSAPYHEDMAFATAAKDWVVHMAGFIKNTLGHDQHLISTCYTGSPFDDQDDLASGVSQHSVYSLGDNSIQNDLFDIGSYNYYHTTIDQHKASTEKALDYTYGSFTTPSYNDIGKPLIHSEFGTGSKLDLCNNDAEWIKAVYISPFTGLASCFNWENKFDYLLYEHFGNVSTFLNMVLSNNNIAFGSWKPHYTTINTATETEIPQVEIYHLNNGDYATRDFGIVMNRTYNGVSEYNAYPSIHNPVCDDFMSNSITTTAFPIALRTRESVPNVDGAHDLNIIMEQGDYIVTWYKYNGSYAGVTQTEHVNILNHKLELDFPELDFDPYPFFFYTAYKLEVHSHTIQDSTDTSVKSQVEQNSHTCTVYPNPLNSFTPLNIHCNKNIVKAYLINNTGNMTKNITGNLKTINLPHLQRGVYQLKLILEDETEESHRIVIID